MTFIQPNLETLLQYLDRLDVNASPNWGMMSAQRMVEHLSDVIVLSVGQSEFPLAIPEDKVEKMQQLLASETPLPIDFKVPFAPEDAPLRNEEIELAIDELVDNWMAFEEFYEANPDQKVLHPFYGELNHEQWLRLHQKHFTHHFKQFGLL